MSFALMLTLTVFFLLVQITKKSLAKVFCKACLQYRNDNRNNGRKEEEAWLRWFLKNLFPRWRIRLLFFHCYYYYSWLFLRILVFQICVSIGDEMILLSSKISRSNASCLLRAIVFILFLLIIWLQFPLEEPIFYPGSVLIVSMLTAIRLRSEHCLSWQRFLPMIQSPLRARVSPTFIWCSSAKKPKCCWSQGFVGSGSISSSFSDRTREIIT